MIKHNGYLWKVRRVPHESEEVAQDRAWYIAKHMKPNDSIFRKETLSRQWANEKYYQMKYSGGDDKKPNEAD